jgi:hypothetical protein
VSDTKAKRRKNMKKIILAIFTIMLGLAIFGCGKTAGGDGGGGNNSSNPPPPSTHTLRVVINDYDSSSIDFGNLIVTDAGETVLSSNIGPANNIATGVKDIIYTVPANTTIHVVYTRLGQQNNIKYTISSEGNNIQTGGFDKTVTLSADILINISLDLTDLDNLPPAAPTGLTVTSKTYSQIVLDWIDSTEADFAGYKLYRKKQGEADFSLCADNLTSSGYTDTNLSPNTKYEYYVIAYDRHSNYSVASQIAEETTSQPPDTPIAYSNGDGNIYVASEDGSYRYTIYSGGDAQGHMWSADKSKIYFINKNNNYIYLLYKNAPQTTYKTNITAAQIFDIHDTKILYRNGDATYIADINGNNFSNQTAFIPEGVNGYPVGSACFSPDGTKVAFNNQVGAVNLSLETFQARAIDENGYVGWIYVANVDGSSPILLLDEYDAVPHHNVIVPCRAVVKDWVGNKILYTNYESQYSSEIFIIHDNGTNMTRMTSGSKHWVRKFSPDGSKILFLDFATIYILNTDNTRTYIYGQDYARSLADW